MYEIDINSLLNGVQCKCGKTHVCNIEKVYVEKGAIVRLAEVCAPFNSILIVADENTFAAAGVKVKSVLKDKRVKEVIFSGKTVLIPDERAIDKVNENIDGVDLILAVGSGVIQDLCKYVSKFSGIPYIDVATAPSMDGYASDGAAMILKGMKETVKAGLPKAIIADTDILKNAPMDMIKAGYGDIIGKFSALNDWKLSLIVNGEYYCPFIYDLTYKMIENTLETAEGLLKREEKSVKALMDALVVVGILISFAGSSRPASGSEHHLSHFFEIVGIVNNEPYLAHGTDVAYSTVITAGLREKLVETDFPKTQYRPERQAYISKMQEVYKSVGDGCVALQDKIGNYDKDRAQIYLDNQEKIKSVLKECPTAKEIEKMLNKVGLDLSEFYAFYGKEKIEKAVKYAKDLKDRYTVLWLNYDIFGE